MGGEKGVGRGGKEIRIRKSVLSGLGGHFEHEHSTQAGCIKDLNARPVREFPFRRSSINLKRQPKGGS